MRLSLIFRLCLIGCLLAPSALLAQASPEPKFTLTLLFDGKPVDESKGVPLNSRTLTATSAPDSQTGKPEAEVVIEKGFINLARENPRVAVIAWNGKGSLETLASQAQPGDRYVVEIEKAYFRNKNGQVKAFPNHIVYSIPLY
ncbi:GldM family protein [Tellurirhabdus rosea]|uniref:GldM family protein n=1 Tax=Tellurirhabdus rosea TaxID=2674997 RepID=UPI00224FD938|nr:hypothetical protein [Tellurirhabdus rosea]